MLISSRLRAAPALTAPKRYIAWPVRRWLGITAAIGVFVLSSPPAGAQEPPEASLTRMERDLSDKTDEVKKFRQQLEDLKAVEAFIVEVSDEISKWAYPAELKGKVNALIEQTKNLRESEPVQAEAQERITQLARDIDRQFKASLRINHGNPEERFSPEQRRLFAQIFREDLPSPQTALGSSSPLELAFGRVQGSRLIKQVAGKLHIDNQVLQDFLKSISDESFGGHKERVAKYLADKRKIVSDRSQELQNKIRSLQADADKLIQSIDKSRDQSTRINEALITFAVPALGILMLGLVLAPRLYKDEKLHLEIFQSGLLLELFTVFFITSTILILGLGKRIDSNVLGTLLGGISGYVLGRSIKDRKPPAAPPSG